MLPFHPFVLVADHSNVMAFQVYGALTTLSNLCAGSVPLKLKFLELDGVRVAMTVVKYFMHHEDACTSCCWALQNVTSYISGFEPGVKAVVSAGAFHNDSETMPAVAGWEFVSMSMYCDSRVTV